MQDRKVDIPLISDKSKGTQSLFFFIMIRFCEVSLAIGGLTHPPIYLPTQVLPLPERLKNQDRAFSTSSMSHLPEAN